MIKRIKLWYFKKLHKASIKTFNKTEHTPEEKMIFGMMIKHLEFKISRLENDAY